MLHYLKEFLPVSPIPATGRAIIDNVSRRSVLTGAATFVVAATIVPEARAYQT